MCGIPVEAVCWLLQLACKVLNHLAACCRYPAWYLAAVIVSAVLLLYNGYFVLQCFDYMEGCVKQPLE
jgi:hypothetical protein